MMDNELAVDIREIKQVIRTADVLLIRFSIFDKRLLLDTRHDHEEGPMVKLVPRAGSAAERFRTLKKLRPRFPLPKNIVSFTWPKHVHSLETMGVWQAILDRLTASADWGFARECDEVFQELLQEERHEILAAITGEGYETIWQRK